MPADGSEVLVRQVDPSIDHLLLVLACRENLSVDDDVTLRDVVSRPEKRRYAVLDPGRGDHGVVVECGGVPIAVAWALDLGADRPGFGFVAAGIPELSVCTRLGFVPVGGVDRPDIMLLRIPGTAGVSSPPFISPS